MSITVNKVSVTVKDSVGNKTRFDVLGADMEELPLVTTTQDDQDDPGTDDPGTEEP